MRIYLVGFMGSGKSTLGQRIAHDFNVPFFDTDGIAEAQSGMTIKEIFESYGEHYFRHLEADILRQSAFYPKSINATGGGLPCFEENMAWMKKHGITIYLEWPEEILKANLLTQREARPLLSSLSDADASLRIADLLQSRKTIYEEAAITIEMQGKAEEDYLLLQKTCKYIW